MLPAVMDWPAAPAVFDPSAQRFESVFSDCQSELLGMLFYQLGDLEEARQTLQDAYVICWRQRADESVADNPRSWVFQIAHDAARDRRTAWQRRVSPCSRPQPEYPTESDAQDARQDRAAAHKTIGRLRAVITQLPPEEQEVFLLRQNGRAAYEQIAESLGLPLRTVKTRMRLALGKLRKALDAVV